MYRDWRRQAQALIPAGVPAYFPSPHNIVGYWKMDGTLGPIGVGETVPSIVGPTATANGVNDYTMEYVVAWVINGIQFTQPADIVLPNAYVTIQQTLDSNNLSVCMWVNTTSGGNLIRSINGDWYVSIDISTGVVFFGDNNGDFVVTGNAVVNDGSWHLIVCTFDNTNSEFATIYVNGAQDSQGSAAGVSMPLSGAFYQVGNGYNGAVEQIGVWQNGILTSGDAASLYNSGAGRPDLLSWTPPESGAAISYYMNCAGTIGVLKCGDAVGASLGSGGIAQGPTPMDYEGGVIGQCTYYDGETSYLSAPSTVGLELAGNYTFTCWINATGNSFGGLQNIIWKANYPTDGFGMIIDFGLFGPPVGSIQWQVSPAGANPSFNFDATDGWAYIAVTWDGASLKMYYNAVLKQTFNSGTTPPALPVIGGTHDLIIGADTDNARFFAGLIDEVCFWNTALSAADLLTIYTNQ